MGHRLRQLYDRFAHYFWLILYRLGRNYESRRVRIFEAFASDLREIGILTIVFLIIDYGIERVSRVDPVTYRSVFESGILAVLAGYFVEFIRDPK